VGSVFGARAESDPRKPYDHEEIDDARAKLRQFIETRPEEVRSDLLKLEKTRRKP
jgi:hypothetical protein